MIDVVIPYNTMPYDIVKPPSNCWHNGPYPIGRNDGPATMAEPISYDDFARLELRVAKVLEAWPHPNADKLLLLQVDVGDQQKQIVAGIREH